MSKKEIFCLLVSTFTVCYLFNPFFSAVLFSPQTYFYSQARTSLPPYHSMNEVIIRNPVGSRRFQIHLCILTWVMSREFTRGSFDELTKKSSKAFCPFKDFQSDQIRRHSRKIKYSLLITHTKNLDLNLARLTDSFLNNQFINRILGRGGGTLALP